MGHEGATVVVNKDGRVVVYMGDDDHREYLFRFVSAKPFNATDRKANLGILDEGELSVAKFESDGTRQLAAAGARAGSTYRGERICRSRRGADQGAPGWRCARTRRPWTARKISRPTRYPGRVYAVMTKSAKRKPDQVDAANPRPENKWGHIVELIPPGEGEDSDHAAAQYKWDILMLCGDPSKPEIGASFHPETTADGFFMTPDNIAFDPKGRMLVATDGMNDFDLADGIFGVDTDGPARALPQALFCAPNGAEVTGPAFTPDGTSMFVSVQHPAENSETIDTLDDAVAGFRRQGSGASVGGRHYAARRRPDRRLRISESPHAVVVCVRLRGEGQV